MTTRRVAARRVEEDIDTAVVPLQDNQAPPQEKVPQGGQVLVNSPVMLDGEIGANFLNFTQVMAIQYQVTTTQAQAMTTQAHREVAPHDIKFLKVFRKAFLDRLFTREKQDAKVEEFINLRQGVEESRTNREKVILRGKGPMMEDNNDRFSKPNPQGGKIGGSQGEKLSCAKCGKKHCGKYLMDCMMLSKRSLYHVGRVKDLESEALPLESFPVVKDFPEIFPDDLPRIPPECEIDFGIDLMPDTKPNLILPYRMAPA
ncbi:hypothetical protein EJD97_000756 [Solanum chilense]|uniref:Retrotransposon gag domain-containing protein n=1 Tax=Solanum chilense TaxID=4083 RepID=A0A6N2C6W0_SOLCI|nr:hypothetical protein EJD97_000756 [Solanum chilense]